MQWRDNGTEFPPGRIYAFHSQAHGICPAMDWHIVAEANGTLEGMISWNGMQDMARATGTYNAQAGTFQMTAKEVGGVGERPLSTEPWTTTRAGLRERQVSGCQAPMVRAV